MQQSVRTVYSAALQTAALLGIPLIIPDHSTLNEKFNILANQTIASTDQPKMRYACIGNGGHSVATGADGIPYIDSVQHRPRDAALFNHLPFVLRTLDNDLSSTEVANYRLRTILTVNGVDYIAYYMKVIDISQTVEEMDLYTVNNGVTTSTTFSPNSNDLNPIPPAITNTGVVQTTGDYIGASAQIPFVMTENDISEFKNVCNILYGDPRFAIISEIALCSGIDKPTSGTFGNATRTYNEAIGVQVMSFISSFFATAFLNNDINMTLNVGSTEALLAS